MFNNIEKMYYNHKMILIEMDGMRPSKSIPRDIFVAINKFKKYYIENKNRIITKNIILK